MSERSYAKEEMKQSSEAAKGERMKEKMPEPSNTGKGNMRDGLRNITLEGSGRSAYPKPKKLNSLGY